MPNPTIAQHDEKVTHTPGPWSAQLADAPFYVEPSNGDDPVICDLLPRDADVFTEEDEANARLIAAAPELLAACKVIALCPHIADYLLEADPKAWEQIEHAIAKAESGTK